MRVEVAMSEPIRCVHCERRRVSAKVESPARARTHDVDALIVWVPERGEAEAVRRQVAPVAGNHPLVVVWRADRSANVWGARPTGGGVTRGQGWDGGERVQIGVERGSAAALRCSERKSVRRHGSSSAKSSVLDCDCDDDDCLTSSGSDSTCTSVSAAIALGRRSMS